MRFLYWAGSASWRARVFFFRFSLLCSALYLTITNRAPPPLSLCSVRVERWELALRFVLSLGGILEFPPEFRDLGLEFRNFGSDSL